MAPVPTDQLVVIEALLASGARDDQLLAVDVDARGAGVELEPHAGRFEVSVGAVREVAPVRDFAGDVVGDAADREVRVGVGDDNGDVGAGVQLAGA